MEVARTVWSDARLDDLSDRIDGIDWRMEAGFARVDDELRALRTETNARFDEIQHGMRTMMGTMMGTMVLGFASLLTTQL